MVTDRGATGGLPASVWRALAGKPPVAPGVTLRTERYRADPMSGSESMTLPITITITATACDVARQLENTRIIRQCSARDLELRKRSIVIEIASIQMFGPRKMCFAAVGSKLERSINR